MSSMKSLSIRLHTIHELSNVVYNRNLDLFMQSLAIYLFFVYEIACSLLNANGSHRINSFRMKKINAEYRGACTIIHCELGASLCSRTSNHASERDNWRWTEAKKHAVVSNTNNAYRVLVCIHYLDVFVFFRHFPPFFYTFLINLSAFLFNYSAKIIQKMVFYCFVSTSCRRKMPSSSSSSSSSGSGGGDHLSNKYCERIRRAFNIAWAFDALSW